MLNPSIVNKTGKASIDAARLESFIGQEVGVSDWALLDQATISAFAETTCDTYFIHTDPERAKAETQFGGTIAHGFLTLSMLAAMAYDALPDIAGATVGMNYGFDKVRFLSPVPSGSKIRGRFRLIQVQRKSGQVITKYAVTVEIDGGEKPALAAEWLKLDFVAA